TRLRRRGWLAGGALYLAMLAPVLPLRHHTYHYYLAAPLAGAAMGLAALGDALWVRAPARAPVAARGRSNPRARSAAANPTRRGFSPGWIVAITLGALLTVNAAMLVWKIEVFPFIHPALRADPIVDRARIAGHVWDALRDATLPPHARLIFWSPEALALQRDAGQDTTRETYFEKNVRGALYDGLAVRVMRPDVDSVTFVRAYRPVDNSHRFVLYGVDGTSRIVAPATVDSAMQSTR